MPKKKQLQDLFVRGKLVTITDGESEVDVWLQKINRFENDKAVREAHKAKSLQLAKLNLDVYDEDRAEYNIRVGEIWDREAMVEVLVVQDTERKRSAREDEVAAEEKWAKDGYLQGILDAWNGGLEDEYLLARDQASEEAQAAWAVINEYNDEVEVKMQAEKRRAAKEYENTDEEELIKLLSDRLIRLDSDAAWLDAYTKWRLVYAIRDPENKTERMLEDVDDLNNLQPEAIAKLSEEYGLMVIDHVEGKDLQEMSNS